MPPPPLLAPPNEDAPPLELPSLDPPVERPPVPELMPPPEPPSAPPPPEPRVLDALVPAEPPVSETFPPTAPPDPPRPEPPPLELLLHPATRARQRTACDSAGKLDARNLLLLIGSHSSEDTSHLSFTSARSTQSWICRSSGLVVIFSITRYRDVGFGTAMKPSSRRRWRTFFLQRERRR